MLRNSAAGLLHLPGRRQLQGIRQKIVVLLLEQGENLGRLHRRAARAGWPPRRPANPAARLRRAGGVHLGSRVWSQIAFNSLALPLRQMASMSVALRSASSLPLSKIFSRRRRDVAAVELARC